MIENTQREDLSDAEKGDAVLSLWANYDKYETIKDVAESINVNKRTVQYWVEKANRLSPKVKMLTKATSLTDEHNRLLLNYSHYTQNRLADVIIRKEISSHKDVLRPFLKSPDG